MVGAVISSGITLWDLVQQTAVAVLQGSDAEVGELVFSHDGRHPIALDGNGMLTPVKRWGASFRTLTLLAA